MIEFSDWQKIEVKIGTVLEAQKIDKSDKLLQLSVDFGDEKRQVVSGIAESYAPEDIIGKQFAFVVNLNPRTIFGIESEAMILAAHSENDKAVLLSPIEKVEPGSKVS